MAAIASGGLAAVAVEPLAARLGTTKGSFYWHYANRDALVEAALARWEERDTLAVLAEVAQAATAPAEQLRLLIARVATTAEQDPIGPALQASAHHPAVAPVLARVTATRVANLTTLFERLGFTPGQARYRAVLAYSAYLGHSHLAHATPEILPADRTAYLDHAVNTLTAPADTVPAPPIPGNEDAGQ